MCVAIVKPAGVDMLPIETLRKCWDANPDGAGFAVSGDSSVRIAKGFMKFEEFAAAYAGLSALEGIAGRAVLIHFRIGTHGNKDAGNTHPFPVHADPSVLRRTEGEYAEAVAHNGVITNAISVAEVSDTGQFIINASAVPGGVLAHWSASKAAVGNSKLALLSPGNRIQIRGSWSLDEDCGCLFSNLFWKYRAAANGAGGTGWRGRWAMEDCWDEDRPLPERRELNSRASKKKARKGGGLASSFARCHSCRFRYSRLSDDPCSECFRTSAKDGFRPMIPIRPGEDCMSCLHFNTAGGVGVECDQCWDGEKRTFTNYFRRASSETALESCCLGCRHAPALAESVRKESPTNPSPCDRCECDFEAENAVPTEYDPDEVSLRQVAGLADNAPKPNWCRSQEVLARVKARLTAEADGLSEGE